MFRAPITFGAILILAIGTIAGSFLSVCILGNLIALVLQKLQVPEAPNIALYLSLSIGAMVGAYVASRYTDMRD